MSTSDIRRLRLALAGVTVVLAAAVSALALSVWNGYDNRRQLSDAARQLCRDAIEDRVDTREIRKLQAQSAGAIADDHFQSSKTRRARRREAQRLWQSLIDTRLRVDPAHGGQRDCNREFPAPSLLPF